jgi:glycosyltransferase involved in cell wall biosynthesis
MRVLYLDAALVNNLGHFANECRFVCGAFRELGTETVVLSHRAIEPELANELGARPHFSFHPNASPSTDPLCGWLISFDTVARTTCDELTRIDGVRHGDLVIYDCARPAQIAALVWWVQKTFEPEMAPSVLITLGWPPGLVAESVESLDAARWRLHDPTAALYRYAVSQIANNFQGSFHFGCPDSTMAAAYSALLDRKVAALPNPHRATTSRRPRAGSRPVCLSFLGEQRPNKGYLMLPAIAERLLASDADLRLVVQNSWELMSDQTAQLQRLSCASGRIRVQVGSVDQAGWNALLEEADLIVLPYDQATYSSVTSGIAAEAIANGIPQVVPQGTCMARLVRDYCDAGVVFETSAVEPVVAAVLAAVADFDALASRAARAAERWAAENSAERLVQAFTGITRSTRR